jgi:hypothetical protein
MAIPPSQGTYKKEDLQLEIDEAKAMVQRVESKLAQMRDTKEAVGEVVEKKAKDAKENHKDDKADKPSYGMKK